MLDMGFAEDIEQILAATPATRQTVLFSATLPPRINAHRQAPPDAIPSASRSDSATRRRAKALVRQSVYVVATRAQGRPRSAASSTSRRRPPRSSSVALAREVDQLTETLNGRGYRAEALHGGMSQEQRDRVMGRLRSGTAELLIATDVAARGLDIDQLTHVVNYDVPVGARVVRAPHRSRRARRPRGYAITLAEPREQRLLANIERLTKQTDLRREGADGRRPACPTDAAHPRHDAGPAWMRRISTSSTPSPTRWVPTTTSATSPARRSDSCTRRAAQRSTSWRSPMRRIGSTGSRLPARHDRGKAGGGKGSVRQGAWQGARRRRHGQALRRPRTQGRHPPRRSRRRDRQRDEPGRMRHVQQDADGELAVEVAPGRLAWWWCRDRGGGSRRRRVVWCRRPSTRLAPTMIVPMARPTTAGSVGRAHRGRIGRVSELLYLRDAYLRSFRATVVDERRRRRRPRPHRLLPDRRRPAPRHRHPGRRRRRRRPQGRRRRVAPPRRRRAGGRHRGRRRRSTGTGATP